MPKILLLYNPKSGSGLKWPLCLSYIEREMPTDFIIHSILDGTIESTISKAVKEGVTTIALMGGDGTVSSLINRILHMSVSVRVAIIPAGTLNHFAQDLGIPLDLEAALRVARNGHSKHVDVAKVNDIYFVNNSSIGFYPFMVQLRESHESRGFRRLSALILALSTISMRRFSFKVQFNSGDRVIEKKTASVFIGNNKYTTEGLKLGSRERLDAGSLFIAMMRDRGLFGKANLLVRSLFGNVLQSADIDVVGLQECTITSRKRFQLVSHDGDGSLSTSPS